MNEKVKIELEFPMKIPKKILYNRLSTINGLNEWFADDVSENDNNEITFSWAEQSMTAKVLEQKKNTFVRFQWLEDSDAEYYFEFLLQTDELTRDTALVVTDFVYPDDKKEAIDLWHKQIGAMMQNMVQQ